MTHEEAIERALKLLRLAKSDNPHEAAQAAARAQEVIDRYKLGALSLEAGPEVIAPDEPVRGFERAPLETGTRLATWKTRLASIIAKANQCRIYLNRQWVDGRSGFGIVIVGRASDAETVRYLYAWLSREVDRLAERDGVGLGTTWRNNFRLGVLDTLSTKLHEQREQTHASIRSDAFARGGESAIVKVNTAIVKLQERDKGTEAFMGTLKLKSARPNYSRYEEGARDAGRKAGQEIQLGAAKRGLGSGRKALGE